MKFLIIKASSLGDIIHAFPALTFLRQKFPEAQIDWVVEAPFADLIRRHSAIDNVLTIETKKWRKWDGLSTLRNFYRKLRATKYDAIFDLQSNIKSTLILMFAKSKHKVGFGWKTAHEWPNALFTNFKANPPAGKNIRDDYLFVLQSYFNDFTPVSPSQTLFELTVEEQKRVDDILQTLPAPHKVLVASGAAWSNKQVSFDALLVSLKKMASEQSVSFLFSYGNANERKIATQFHAHFQERSIILDPLPLPLLQNLMSKVDLVIAMDSLPLHLCGTTMTASYSYFGPTKADKFLPLGPQHRFIQGSCPYGITFKKQCPRLRTCKTASCIKSLQAEISLQAK